MCIVAAISINILLRNLFMSPIYGLLDLVEYGLLLLTFSGAPWVLSKYAHVTVDLVTSAVPLNTAQLIARYVSILGFCVSLVVAIYSLEAVVTSQSHGSMIRTAFVIPEWWVLSIMPASFTLLALEFLRQAISPSRNFTTPKGL
ncbi:MAG: TRAP transporter small permease [Planktomarina sp.]|nr:TRAP transporter small permease [Planktomarina sp.]